MAVVTVYKQQQQQIELHPKSVDKSRKGLNITISESVDPSGRAVLNRGSEATLLLGLRVRIQAGGIDISLLCI
jgi:hypothetical protein